MDFCLNFKPSLTSVVFGVRTKTKHGIYKPSIYVQFESPIYAVIWLCRGIVTWLFGGLATWLFGGMVTWLCVRMVTWLFLEIVLWLFESMITWLEKWWQDCLVECSLTCLGNVHMIVFWIGDMTVWRTSHMNI